MIKCDTLVARCRLLSVGLTFILIAGCQSGAPRGGQSLISYEPEGEVPGLTEERGLPLHQAVEASLSSTRFAAMLQEDPGLDVVELDVLEQLGVGASQQPIQRCTVKRLLAIQVLSNNLVASPLATAKTDTRSVGHF